MQHVNWQDIESGVSPTHEFLRIRSSEQDTGRCRVRIVGKPIRICRVWLDKHQKFEVVKPEIADRLKLRDYMKVIDRYACVVIDQTSRKVKIAEFPVTVMQVVRDAKDKIEKRRRYHGRKNAFEIGAKYGAELDIELTGRGIATRYDVSVTPHLMKKVDYNLLGDQGLPDLEQHYKL